MLWKGKKNNNHAGMILAIVLVILTILIVMAIGLSRTARMNLTLARRSLSAVSVKYLAWAGVVYAIDEIRKDSQDKDSRAFDRIGLCGIVPDETLTLKERFGQQDLKGGYFEIGYDDGFAHIDGFSDEESKINLNGLTKENIGILISLLQMFSVDEERSKKISYSLLDWKDSDDDISLEDFGAEDAHYMDLARPYHVKNAFIESFEELLLINGMDAKILERIRPYITLYPQDDFLRVNLDTASLMVLKSVGRSFTGGQTGSDAEDADALAEKLVSYRNGDDGHPGTSDDRTIVWQDVNLNQKEQVVAEKLKMIQTTISDYLHVRVNAVESQRRMAATVEAVIDRNNLAIVQWQRK